jgi:transcriptional regulator with XRE-family HTH domain
MSANGTNDKPEVRRLRRAAGLTQQELAERAGCSISYVRLLERGYAPSFSEVITRLERVLNEKRPGGHQVVLRTSAAEQGRHEPE